MIPQYLNPRRHLDTVTHPPHTPHHVRLVPLQQWAHPDLVRVDDDDGLAVGREVLRLDEAHREGDIIHLVGLRGGGGERGSIRIQERGEVGGSGVISLERQKQHSRGGEAERQPGW